VVQRIVSIAPSNTEILQALGLLDRLVGVDDWSDWPPEVQSLPRLGPDLDIDMDRLEALRPDLVLASLSVPGMEKNVQRLTERSIPFILLDPHSLSEIWADIRSVGHAAGVTDRAEVVVADLQRRVEMVSTAARGRQSRSLYWEWWPRPIYTPGRRNWLTEISNLVGCQNLYADYDVDNVRVDDPLDVVRRAPDAVLLAWTGAKRPRTSLVYKRPGWQSLAALQSERVFIMEEGLFNRPSPRLVEGLEYLSATLARSFPS